MAAYSFSGQAPGVETYTVQQSGTYDLVAYGAQGGTVSSQAKGGYGAEIGGAFVLTAGEQLKIVVGGHGSGINSPAGGGGGFSEVLASSGGGASYSPLLIAGGGGGAAVYQGNFATGGDAMVGSPGTMPGNGGRAGYGNNGGAGGAGGLSNGSNTNTNGEPLPGSGGSTAPSYAGGKGLNGANNGGGFGGGGAGQFGGGGGGGSTGGHGGTAGVGGAGGTSYFSSMGTLNEAQAGERKGDGAVTITQVFGGPVCFAAGTRIRVMRCGAARDVAVEHLAVGDRAIAASGALRPIRWLGHRVTDCARHREPALVKPVRIAAHAFGPSRPSRDLIVSPGHALCLDAMGELLVPASALVNGGTVRQIEVDTITYWHVELDAHDLLLAENLACESYLDMGNRAFFAEVDAVALYARPDAPVSGHADFCRPYVDGGPLLEALKARLGRTRKDGRRTRGTSAAA